MRVAVIGSGGMLGHMVYLKLKNAGHTVHGYSKSVAPTVDCVMAPEQIARVSADVIVNCAGILNAACDQDQETALNTNGMLPHKLAKNCDFFVQISTDCVFDGTQDWKGVKDTPNATSMYGRTKALGEIADSQNAVTLRQSIIGPSLKQADCGLLHWALTHPGPLVPGFLNHTWNGVTTLELAGLICRILEARNQGKRIAGLYHYVCSESIDKADLLVEMGRVFGCPWSVEMTEKPPLLRTLAPDSRIKPPPTITEQLALLRAWMGGRKALYRHYQVMEGWR